jgi:glycogen debranching enzyme GlgX
VPGVSLTPDGVDADVFAPTAEGVDLCLFDGAGHETRHRLTSDGSGYHRGFVAGVPSGIAYGLRTHGPWDPGRGLWHHPSLLLLDPHARAVTGRFEDHPSVHHQGPRQDTAARVPKGVLVPTPPRPRPGPGVPWSETVIYETHVRGLTRLHPDVPEGLRGTYAGAASAPVIDHLRRLGVTTVELLPVAHFVPEPFLQARGLTNYWGYSTLAWFAPHSGYATGDGGRVLGEFVAMVDAFHAAGLEVIVDVVFNHTVEGNLNGPILSMKGLDNGGWYRLDDQGGYVDWTGTGNTVATHHPHVRQTILEALRWWRTALGVDGFRFDLGVTLGRGPEDFDPANLRWLNDDPALAGCKLIAEPWDLGPHGYRLGGFGGGWSEWNARFRDDVRDFWTGRGDPYTLATRMTGSPDVFGERAPAASINFVTAHDGFTLGDLVSYDHKHNHANGEANGDGHDDNRSWNSGVEGPTDDPDILEVRRRRARAHLATLLLASGVPMLLGGDELGRTQGGNNNSYPLDNGINWYDWSSPVHGDLIQRATACRRRFPLLWSGHRQVVGSEHGAGRAAIEIRNEEDSLLLVPCHTEDDVPITLPPGQWRLELDSTGLEAEGEIHSGEVIVPAWSLRLYSAAG